MDAVVSINPIKVIVDAITSKLAGIVKIKACFAVTFSSSGLRVASHIRPTKNSAKNIEAH